ncbi:unnamed protein product [Coccothraustes coccothraustes]
MSAVPMPVMMAGSSSPAVKSVVSAEQLALRTTDSLHQHPSNCAAGSKRACQHLPEEQLVQSKSRLLADVSLEGHWQRFQCCRVTTVHTPQDWPFPTIIFNSTVQSCNPALHRRAKPTQIRFSLQEAGIDQLSMGKPRWETTGPVRLAAIAVPEPSDF